MSIVFSMIVQENLPNDTVELKGLVYQLLDVVEQQKLLIANQNERIEAQFLRIEGQSQEIKALSLKNEEQSQQLQAQSQKIEEQAHQIDQLTHQVNLLKRHRYGKRSEKTQEDDSKQNDSDNLPSSPDAHLALAIKGFATL
ncbi:MAG: transposase [Alphaproteobacteria bacterium]|nr:transposase [Alphaproteobacteria bacterium]